MLYGIVSLLVIIAILLAVNIFMSKKELPANNVVEQVQLTKSQKIEDGISEFTKETKSLLSATRFSIQLDSSDSIDYCHIGWSDYIGCTVILQTSVERFSAFADASLIADML